MTDDISNTTMTTWIAREPCPTHVHVEHWHAGIRKSWKTRSTICSVREIEQKLLATGRKWAPIFLDLLPIYILGVCWRGKKMEDWDRSCLCPQIPAPSCGTDGYVPQRVIRNYLHDGEESCWSPMSLRTSCSWQWHGDHEDILQKAQVIQEKASGLKQRWVKKVDK